MMTKGSGRTRTLAGHVRFVRDAMRRAGPDGHGHTPLGVSGCPAADGVKMAAVRIPHSTLTGRHTLTVSMGPTGGRPVEGSAEPRLFTRSENFEIGIR